MLTTSLPNQPKSKILANSRYLVFKKALTHSELSFDWLFNKLFMIEGFIQNFPQCKLNQKGITLFVKQNEIKEENGPNIYLAFEIIGFFNQTVLDSVGCVQMDFDAASCQYQCKSIEAFNNSTSISGLLVGIELNDRLAGLDFSPTRNDIKTIIKIPVEVSNSGLDSRLELRVEYFSSFNSRED